MYTVIERDIILTFHRKEFTFIKEMDEWKIN